MRRQASSKRIGIDSRGHLRIIGLRGGDEGNYSCVASNMAGARESKSVALVVLSESVVQMSRFSKGRREGRKGKLAPTKQSLRFFTPSVRDSGGRF